jgi:hypothetical protein
VLLSSKRTKLGRHHTRHFPKQYCNKKIKDKKIFFIEGSEIKKEHEEMISESVDCYYNCKKDDVYGNLSSPEKARGEAFQTLAALSQINLDQYDNFMKISGRYFLNEDFCEEKFLDNETFFRFYYPSETVSTVFYKVNKKHFNILKDSLKYSLKYGGFYERNFFYRFKDCSKNIEYLGATGLVSVTGQLWIC